MDKDTPLALEEELRKICLEIEDDEDAPVDIFIRSAHIMVYEYLADAEFSIDRLTLIELYLAAHFATITYPITSSEGIGGKVHEAYQYKVGLGLEYTKYGQQALSLSNGMLANKRVGVSWVGSIS